MSLHITHHGCPNWTSAGCVCVEPITYREDAQYKLGYRAGMLEAARLCREFNDENYDGPFDERDWADMAADAIESSAKGE